MAAIKALQQWCRQQCEGYRDVSITNMTTSFRDGLAFCAILHRHRPDLINFNALSKENIYENNKLAFQVAEEKLGIPALLDAEDMVALKVPDRLSILTYVSQYYNYFHGRSPIGGIAGVKRPPEDSKEQPVGKKVTTGPVQPTPPTPSSGKPLTPARTNPAVPTKSVVKEYSPVKASVGGSDRSQGTVSSDCAVCGRHVHLVQRHLVDGKLFHRNCFRCKQCSNTLHSGTYRPAEEPGSFLCINHHPKASTPPASSPVSAKKLPAPASTPRGQAGPMDITRSGFQTPKARESEKAGETGLRTPGYRPAGNGAPESLVRPNLWSPTPRTGSTVPSASPGLNPPKPPPSSFQSTPSFSKSHIARDSSPPTSRAGKVPDRSPVGWPPTAQSRSSTQVTPSSSPWTASAVKTQQAREKFFQSGGSGTPVSQAPATRDPGLAPPPPRGAKGLGAAGEPPLNSSLVDDNRKDQARNVIMKNLPRGSSSPHGRIGPSPQGPTRLTSSASPGPGPEAEGPRGSPTAKQEAVSTRPRPGRSQASLQGAGAKGPASGSSTSFSTTAGQKRESPASLQDQGSCSSKDIGGGPEGWRAKLKPVEKKSGAERKVLDPKEKSRPAEESGIGVLKKSPGSSVVTIQINVSPAQKEHKVAPVSPSPPKPSPGLTASSTSPAQPRKRLIPQNLDLSIHWLSPEQKWEESVLPSGKEQSSWSAGAGRTSALPGLQSPPTEELKSPGKFHPDYVPEEEIQKKVLDIQKELDVLELQGVELEKRLREAEGDESEDALMVEWFKLIHEKQLLLRLESELMYKSKDQHLEEEQFNIEGELRRLMAKPDALKTQKEREREQELLVQYVSTVNDRSDIVDCLDEDRLRELEEDQVLQDMIQRLDLHRDGCDRKKKSKFQWSKIWRQKSKSKTSE
ncbi:MICAL-like protein 2 [Ornithorhynchus anatinus]|uniref:MICAL-like protein 2 n=1 Tax=Ornithorhynchus anatinus TaxID=9258 RepID=UPI0010A92F19|nr:MICAL-like protein 2 [Ornithorhynchus anatinus]